MLRKFGCFFLAGCFCCDTAKTTIDYRGAAIIRIGIRTTQLGTLFFNILPWFKGWVLYKPELGYYICVWMLPQAVVCLVKHNATAIIMFSCTATGVYILQNFPPPPPKDGILQVKEH